MKVLVRGIIGIIILSLLIAFFSVHSNNITVYTNSDGVIRYNIIKEEQLSEYIKAGWSLNLPGNNMLTHIAMYSYDGRMENIPNENSMAQSVPEWYYMPEKVMHSSDNQVVAASSGEIKEYEGGIWYFDPVILMTDDTSSRYVALSELGKYRMNGWQIKEYTWGLNALDTELKNYISGKSGKYGIYVKNLDTGEILVINDGKYMSASIIKLFVMAATYNEISNGNVAQNNTINRYLKNMITVSDNYSSNLLVRSIGNGNYKNGFNSENDFLRSQGCINTVHQSLFIGYGDYVSYGRNSVSPLDCGIILEKIYNGTLVSEEYSKEMLDLLKQQTRRNKIPYLLPKEAVCANKTGETSNVQSDVGIVYSPNCDYIICVITNNTRSGINDVRNISKITYDYFNKQ